MTRTSPKSEDTAAEQHLIQQRDPKASAPSFSGAPQPVWGRAAALQSWWHSALTYLLAWLSRSPWWPFGPIFPWLPRIPSDAWSSTDSCLSLGRMKTTGMILALPIIISHHPRLPCARYPNHAQQRKPLGMLGVGFKPPHVVLAHPCSSGARRAQCHWYHPSSQQGLTRSPLGPGCPSAPGGPGDPWGGNTEPGPAMGCSLSPWLSFNLLVSVRIRNLLSPFPIIGEGAQGETGWSSPSRGEDVAPQ